MQEQNQLQKDAGGADSGPTGPHNTPIVVGNDPACQNFTGLLGQNEYNPNMQLFQPAEADDQSNGNRKRDLKMDNKEEVKVQKAFQKVGHESNVDAVAVQDEKMNQLYYKDANITIGTEQEQALAFAHFRFAESKDVIEEFIKKIQNLKQNGQFKAYLDEPANVNLKRQYNNIEGDHSNDADFTSNENSLNKNKQVQKENSFKNKTAKPSPSGSQLPNSDFMEQFLDQMAATFHEDRNLEDAWWQWIHVAYGQTDPSEQQKLRELCLRKKILPKFAGIVREPTFHKNILKLLQVDDVFQLAYWHMTEAKKNDLDEKFFVKLVEFLQPYYWKVKADQVPDYFGKPNKKLEPFFESYVNALEGSVIAHDVRFSQQIVNHMVQQGLIDKFASKMMQSDLNKHSSSPENLLQHLKNVASQFRGDVPTRHSSRAIKIMYAVMLVTGLTEDVVLHLMPHPEAFLSKNNIEKLQQLPTFDQATVSEFACKWLQVDSNFHNQIKQVQSMVRRSRKAVEALNQRKNRKDCFQERNVTFEAASNMLRNCQNKDQDWLNLNVVQAKDLTKIQVAAKEQAQVRTVDLTPQQQQRLEDFKQEQFKEHVGLEVMYGQIEIAAQTYIEKQISSYKIIPKVSQKIAAARLALSIKNNQRAIMQLGAGQGKTLILILAALALLEDKEAGVQKVLVFVLHQELENQFNSKFEDFEIDPRVTVTYQPQALLYDDSYDLIFVDEGDRWLKENGVTVYTIDDDVKLCGLYSLLDKKFAMLSATFNNVERKIMKEIMGCPKPDQWIKSPDLLEILTGEIQKCQIRYEFAEGKNHMVHLKKLIKFDRPNLIFIEDLTPDLIRDITAMVKNHNKKLYIHVIEDSQSLREVQEDAGEFEEGIFLIVLLYSRGIDIKLAKDSNVIICANGQSLTFGLSEAQQMGGRGNRAQGAQSATVLFFHNYGENQKPRGEATLRVKDSLDEPSSAVVLKNLFEKYPREENTKLKATIIKALENQDWVFGLAPLAKNVKDWILNRPQQQKGVAPVKKN